MEQGKEKRADRDAAQMLFAMRRIYRLERHRMIGRGLVCVECWKSDNEILNAKAGDICAKPSRPRTLEGQEQIDQVKGCIQ